MFRINFQNEPPHSQAMCSNDIDDELQLSLRTNFFRTGVSKYSDLSEEAKVLIASWHAFTHTDLISPALLGTYHEQSSQWAHLPTGEFQSLQQRSLFAISSIPEVVRQLITLELRTSLLPESLPNASLQQHATIEDGRNAVAYLRSRIANDDEQIQAWRETIVKATLLSYVEKELRQGNAQSACHSLAG